MKKYPIKLSSFPMSRIWGGEALKKEWGFKSEEDSIAEEWVLSCREDKMSVAENGELKGTKLCELAGAKVPLLIKLIDAADKLSVQVHPDDEIAMQNAENDSGKNEMWYVLDAKEGASIVYGLKENVSVTELFAAAERGQIEELLNFVPVKKGDSFYIPAGLVHGIGGGILIAEIQQNSDLTYRIYDYCRTDKNGKMRELHTTKGSAAIKKHTEDDILSSRYEYGKPEESCLANNRYFKVTLLRADEDGVALDTKDSFKALLVTDGNATLYCDGEKYEMKKGDLYFLPEGTNECLVKGNAEILVSQI